MRAAFVLITVGLAGCVSQQQPSVPVVESRASISLSDTASSLANKRRRDAAGTLWARSIVKWTECVKNSADTFALKTTEPAETVAKAALGNCETYAQDYDRANVLDSPKYGAGAAESLKRSTEPTLVARILKLRQSAQESAAIHRAPSAPLPQKARPGEYSI